MELIINEEKTKFMQVTSKPIRTSELIVGEQKFEVVQHFKYLGTIVTNDISLDIEIRYRISLENNCYHRLKHQLRSQFLNLRTKLNLYKTLLKPVLTYGSECWSLNRRNEEQLQVFERRMLRKIFGPICDNGKWRIRYNSELYSIYNSNSKIKTCIDFSINIFSENF